MKLEHKLGLATGALILAMLLSAFTATTRIREANRLATSATTQHIPINATTRDLRVRMLYSVHALESYMLFGIDPASSAAFRRGRQQYLVQAEESMAKLRQYVAQGNLGYDATRIREIETGFTTLKSLEEKVEQLNESKTSQGTAQAYDVFQNQILPLEKSLFALSGDLGDSQMEQANLEITELQRANSSTLWTLWIATLIGAIVGGVISFVLSRRITRSIDLVAERADAIAEGNLTGNELNHLYGNDQIGTLAKAMQKMQSNLSSIIGTVVQTASSLTGSTASMRTASDQIHRRIDQQSQQTQQAATAMQEMSASIAEVSRHTQSAAETARNAAQTAREGGDIVKQVLGSMHSIATAVTETSATVGLLGEDSKRISQIVTVIDEIARKTNLLALNAAIEAARAGDHGRGFAVVAGEVRRLAESTAQATGEIATMIQEIQDRTRVAISSMESGTGTVQQGVVTTNQAGEALERIIGMAERVDKMITQIAIAASQQAAAADQSSASLDAIHSLSNENLAGMATTASGIESLRSTTVMLEEQVDRFQLQSHSMKLGRSIETIPHSVPAASRAA
ncbi:methyl-accepting chemotaxis protein [Edaphobacter albus]|uniref:methyl-accepting chemotaxis protein n=1 Tax=Edaphobacter sp. 4G125 TaxID=2763071 RepID=UPI001646AD20|nr:methyl-accepting chemotaxis protein [Edaphobacter sp. 4G125]QNI35378.1 methyl-accepting chemotaxis protein [Edaphobacter sp. 4G125]